MVNYIWNVNYSDLLNTTEWKERRHEILERDNYTCQRCGINSTNFFEMRSGNIMFNREDKFDFIKLNKNKYLYDIVIIKSGGKSFVGKTYFSNNVISKLGIETFRLTFNIILKDYHNSGIEQSYKMGLNPKYDIFTSKNLNKKRIETFKEKNPIKLNFNKYDFDLNGFWLIESKEFYSFKKSHSLHVHHNCYRKRYKIWKQPNSDYISLCNICHKIIHEYYLIPYYDKEGRVIQYLEFCDKCDGLGVIPCYSHISGGICFKCSGAGILNEGVFN